jgi:hypothetical protein
MARNLFDELGIKPVIPESANPGVLRSAGDLGLEVVSGGIKGLRFITDVAGADNAVSGGLRVADQAVKGLQSLRAQYEDEEVARIMRDAEDKGVGEQAMQALRAAGIAPVRMGLGAVATGAPVIAASLLPGVREASWGARLGVLGGVGAVQGTGVVKSAIYDQVYERARQEGRSEADARSIATQAQSYAENPGLIAGGAALGGAASVTGVEGAIARVLGREAAQSVAASTAQRGVVPFTGSVLAGVAREVPLEAAQGGQEQYAANVATDRAGFPTPAYRGVAGSAVLEGALAAPGGAVGGALDYANAGLGQPAPVQPSSPTPPSTPTPASTPRTPAPDPLVRLAELDVLAQTRALTPQEQALRARLSQQLGVPSDEASILPLGVTPTGPGTSAPADTELDAQNRDRTRAASIAQMQSIAANPDYLRLGPSRSPDAGAPMVFAVGDDTSLVPPSALGREDVAVMADGRRVPFRYAVVDANALQPSNFADGSVNPAFGNAAPGTLKALNNGRTAGLRRAYEAGTAANYQAELERDAPQHGVDPAVIRSTANPVLVRLYADASNVANMAALSQGQGLGMSPAELARQDARLIDSSVLAMWQGGDVASRDNRDFVRAFVGKLHGAGQDIANLMTGEGFLSPTGRSRIQAAMAQAAYGDPDLISEMFESTDTDIKTIGEALKLSAGAWANLRDSVRAGTVEPSADITPAVVDAVRMIRRARQDRRSLHDLSRQVDLTTGQTPDPLMLSALRLFYGGEFLTRPLGRDRVVSLLEEYTRLVSQAGQGGGLFGDTPAPSDVLTELTKEITPDGQANTPPAQPQGAGQSDGSGDPRGAAGAPGQPGQGPIDNTGRPPTAAGGAGPLANAGAGAQTATGGVAPAAIPPAATRPEPTPGQLRFGPDEVVGGLTDAMDRGLEGVKNPALRDALRHRGLADNSSITPQGQALHRLLMQSDEQRQADLDFRTAQDIVDTAVGFYRLGGKPPAAQRRQTPASSAPASAPATRQGATNDEEGQGQEAPETGVLTPSAGAPGQTPGAPVDSSTPAAPSDATAAAKPNTIFTEDAAQAARERLRKKLGRLQSGIDPETLLDGITLAGYHIERGARRFAAYARAMVDDLGEAVKPYLVSWYLAVRNDPRAASFKADMDRAADVEDIDVDAAIAQDAQNKRNAQTDNTAPELQTTQNAAERPSLTTASGRRATAQALADRLLGGEGFKTIVEARKFIAELTGQPVEPGTQAAKRADETVEVAVVLAGREIVAAARRQGRTDGVIYDRLVNLYGLQPVLGMRSSTSVREQAYSTPVPLAFLASRLAGIKPGDKVGEPTAGNTMLLIEVAPKDAVVNELNAERADNARALGFEVQRNDAATSALAPPKSLDVAVMNPPFGVVRDDKGEPTVWAAAPFFATREVDHAIAMKALESLKDDGRAVLIVGGVDARAEDEIRDGYRAKAKREFYFRLYNDYQVVDHFTVDGDLYARQGAGYPVDVIVIAGRGGKATRPLPAAQLPVRFDSWPALKEKLDANAAVNAPGAASGSGAVVSPERPGGSVRGDGAPGRTDAVGVDGRRGGPDQPNGGSTSARPADGQSGAVGDGRDGSREGIRGGRQPVQPQPASADGAVSSDEQSDQSVPGQGARSPDGADGGRPGGAGGNRSGGVAGDGPGRDQLVKPGLSDRRGQEQETAGQVAYTPGSSAPSVGTLVPRAMRDSVQKSLERVQAAVGDLDAFVAQKLEYDPLELAGYFSAEQVDALALAIYNAEQGRGFIIGDQTGIGKGRVVAGMIRYALRSGKVPIFVTEKPNLYADMIRDLDDIGMAEELGLSTQRPGILMTNSKESIDYTLQRERNGDRVELELVLRPPASGPELNKLMDGMVGEGSLGRFKVIFTTYSQIQTVAGKTTARMRFLQAFADGGYVIFDESHNAGGTSTTQARTKEQREALKQGEDKLGRAGFARVLVRNSAGSFFSSATYAKRPDVMDLYSSTNMMLAVEKPTQLAPAIQTGGVPLQQIVATMLSEDGQYIRRERTFAGVGYETRATTVDKATAENMATAMRMVLAFSRAKEAAVEAIKKELDKEGAVITEKGTEKATVQGANFGAIMHNLIDQMLLALKAQDSVDFAIERLKAGEKVVLTVANTMGSFLADYAKEMDLRPGEPVALSFRDLYLRYLEKQRVITIKRPGGAPPEQSRLTDEQLGESLVKMFNRTAEFIGNAGFGAAPISPIDFMHNRLREAGFKTDEITGRNITVNYAGPSPVLANRTANIRQRLRAIRGFNGGEVDALILNQSGSTGLSLHASAKVKDQRKRRMIIVQAERNIDTHMQMLGRVHRTGQVITPDYTQAMADIPAEMRPAAVLMKKMASLNANTTASRKSAVTAEGVVDFMNDYGGQVAAEFLMDNPDVHAELGGQDRLEVPDKVEEADDELIRKLTGYIPILPIKQQEEIYADLTQRYNDLIAREDAMGTNKLEAKALNLGAKTLSSEQVTAQREGDAGSRFAEPAHMEKVDVARTVKPMSSAEVEAAIAQSLGGQTALKMRVDMIRDLSARTAIYVQALRAKLEAADTDPLKIQRQVDTVGMQKNLVEETLRNYGVGDQVTVLDSMQVPTYGIITSIANTGTTKNPAAGSSWKITLALANGDARSLTLSVSQLGRSVTLRKQVEPVAALDPKTDTARYYSIPELFDLYSGGSGNVRREQRWMVTGNLLAGFAKFPGQIVSYTTDDGRVQQGVLMRRGYDFEKVKQQAAADAVVFTAPVKLMQFFERAGGGATVRNAAGTLRILRSHGEGAPTYSISVAAAKREGGTYYLDQRLIDALRQDFYKRGDVMSVRNLNEATLRRAVEHLLQVRADGKLIPVSHPDVAREVLGLPPLKTGKADGDANLAREESGVYNVNDPVSNYDLSYDLFPETQQDLQPVAGRALPRARGGDLRSRAGQATSAGDVLPTATLSVRSNPTLPGVYQVNDQLVQVNVRDLPVASVKTWQDAVDALQAIGDYAVEHMDVLITNMAGKPLAVVGSFKGAIAQTAVYPTTILAEALRIKGAATAWGVHNHPSGSAELSRADEYLNQAVASVFRDTSIRWTGMAAVANGGDWRAVEGDGANFVSGKVRPGKTVARIPVVDRLIRRVDSANVVIDTPSRAKDVVQNLAGGQPGIVFVSHSHRVTAWVPMIQEEMLSLTKEGRLDRLLNSGAFSGSAAYLLSIPVQGGSKVEVARAERAAQNMANALARLDLRLLDVIDPVTRSSMAERGTQPSGSVGGTLSNLAPMNPGRHEAAGVTRRSARKALEEDFAPDDGEAEVPRIQAARRLSKLAERLAKGEIDDEQYILAVRMLTAELDAAAQAKRHKRVFGRSRKRGADLVRERLLQARRRGDLDPDDVAFALWALDRNPALAADLGISIESPGEDTPSGDYNPTTRVMRLFKGDALRGTAVHEILHHAERMMPAPMQGRIRAEWAKALAAGYKNATSEQRQALDHILPAMAGDRSARDALKSAFAKGVLKYDPHYQLVNPSEFWAVNATRLLHRRYAASDAMWRRIMVWMREMVERIKGLLGARADAAVLRAMEYVVGADNDGSFQSRQMLFEGVSGILDNRKASDITTMARLQRVLREGVGGRPVYLRFARDIEGDVRGRRSKNWVDGRREMGLSVVQLVESPDALGYYQPFEDLPQDHPANLGGGISNYIDYLGFRHAKGAYLVTGDVVGIGSDGEPLLVNASVIGELSKTVLVEGLMAWSQEQERRDVQQGRAPGLVASNEKFLTNELRLGAELEEVKRAASAPDAGPSPVLENPAPARRGADAEPDVNRMTPAQIEAEIRELIPRVEKAYEAGPRSASMAERLDARLETLMDALESSFAELEEDQMTRADLLNPLLLHKLQDGEAGDSEADIVRDLANVWREMTDARSPYGGMMPPEQADFIRGMVDDYAWRHGGMEPNLPDSVVLDAAQDAFAAVYGLRARQLARIQRERANASKVAPVRRASDGRPVLLENLAPPPPSQPNAAGPNPPPQPGPAQRSRWQALKQRVIALTSPEALDKLIYEFQDKFVDLKRIRARIQALGGAISDLNDAYLGEELFHKRLARRTQVFLDDELRPLLAEMRERGVTMEDFERYLHARHAAEANAEMARRNPSQVELDARRAQANADVKALELRLQSAVARGTSTRALNEALDAARETQSVWRRAQAFRGTEEERLSLSGMSDAEAAAVIAALTPPRLADMDALAARVDAVNARTLELLEHYGLMERSVLDAWRRAYRYYVPLHRDEAHPDSVAHPTGMGFNVKGPAARQRVGSNERVTHILGHIAMQREAALTRGEKDLVLKKLYVMAAQNPDPDLWRVDELPVIKVVDPFTRTVRKVADPNYRNLPYVLMLRIAGQDVAITFNERNPQALRLAHSLKNLDIGDLHAAVTLVAKGTRWFASVNTQYNPVFGVINFARDAQSGLLNLSTTALAGREREVASGVFPALRAIYRQERGKQAANPANRQWIDLWKQLQEAGGSTGYRDLYANIEDRTRELEKELGRLDRGAAGKTVHYVLDWLSDYNEAMENAVRVSAFKVALDQGMSTERAASLAKNLTVNFNRKGRQTREIGAFYAFFNAAIQGTVRMWETLRGPMGRKIMLGGVLLGAVNALIGMAVMGGDDDGDDHWDKIPEFVKERSLIVPLGREDYLSIPLPLGFHFLPNVGRLAVEFMLGGPDKTAGRQIGRLLQVMLDAFNPLGGSQTFSQMVTPTVADPAVALWQNRDWTGRPIYRETMNPLDPQPGTAMAKDSATPWAKAASELTNWITGGTKYQPGMWSPTPDQIDYVIGQLTGGIGREIGKLAQTVSAPYTGDELPPHKIPLLGRLYGNTRGISGQSEAFYENVKRLNQIENELQGRAKNREDVEAYRRGEPLADMVAEGNKAEAAVSRLRRMRREVQLRQEEGYQERVRGIDAEIARVMEGLNRGVTGRLQALNLSN